MEVSKLTFRKETIEKMNKPLNRVQRGKLRWAKLKELEDGGKLSHATNRQEVAEMLGATKEYGPEYTWVSNLIKRGNMREILTGFGDDNRPIYEYHTTSNVPEYDEKAIAEKAAAGRKAAATGRRTAAVRLAPTPVATPTPNKAFAVPSNDGAKMTIRYKELVIELENISQATIEAIVEKLADKQ